MKLVIGGAYQGKLAFAINQFQIEPETILDGRTCPIGGTKEMKGIHHLHEYVRRLLVHELDPKEEVIKLVREHNDLILICNEMGCGLVPIKAFDRKYRETVGRIQCELALRSTEVYRVYCGVGVKIK